MSESFADQMSRLRQMCDEGSETWDLSDNDRAAISTVLASHDALLEALKYFAALKDCDEESEACEGNSGPYCSTHGDTDLHVDAIKAARAAIAKAEGSLP
jgi:hypothetical protein